MNTHKRENKKMEKKRIITLTLSIFFISLLAIGFASANKMICLTRGESVPSAQNPEYTCDHDRCSVCVDSQRHPNVPPQSCKTGCEVNSGDNGSSVNDTTAPVLTINHPTNTQLFNSRKVLIDFFVSEGADVYYTDAVNGRGRWSKLCSNCVTYSKNLSFDEGQNIIQFKAIDNSGNIGFSNNVSFFADSKKPKIRKTLPKVKAFGNGDFDIDFQEANPSTLTLFYGNNGSSSMNVPLSNCIKDNKSNEKYSCTVHADLGAYNGQMISYLFILTDIVGNSVSSKPVNIKVDLTAPVINNPGSFFTHENNSKYVYFNMSITETNFNEVLYSYVDNKGKVREKTLCSTLKEGMCVRKVIFAKGEWNLTVSAWDDAGNSVALPADFIVS